MGRVELIQGKPLPIHKDYARQATARRFWRRSDAASWDYVGTAGAPAYDASGTCAILQRHERETADRYARRISQAIGRSYQRQILDRYNDHVFRIPAQRPIGGTEYKQLLDDADGSGSTLNAVIKRALRKAQAEGPCFLLADSNIEQVFTTRADEIAAGKRGTISIVGADQVVWWRIWRGTVIEAVVLLADKDGDDYAYYVTDEITQKISIKGQTAGALTITGIEAPVAHNYGGCPLVALAPQFGESDCIGDTSQGGPLAESIKRICNIDSWLLEETQGATFTTPVFIGVSADQVKVTTGPGQAVCLESTGASISKISADPANADSLRASLERETNELYRAAGVIAGSPTQVGQPESGVAKAFAFNEIEAKLTALANAAEHAENTIVARISSGNGWTYPGDAKYPTSFAIPDLANELDFVIRVTTAPLPQVIKEKAINNFAASSLKLNADEMAELDSELEEQQQMRAEDAITSGIMAQSDLAPDAGTTSSAPSNTAGIAAQSTDVQGTALNGAQVTALQKIMEGVANETLPGDAAKILITEAFPAFNEAKIKAMIASAVKFTPKVISQDSTNPALRNQGT